MTFPSLNKEYVKLLKASDRSEIFLVTGALKVTFTNLGTGKAIAENVSGPAKITTHADGSVTLAGKGHGGPVMLAPADAQRFGLPVVSVVAGALTESMAADGTLTSLSLNGHVLVDVCTALS